MKKPSIEVKYVLVCDDVRTEEGSGKSIVIGLYNEDIVLSASIDQFVAPLTFLIRAILPERKKIPVTLWIEGPNGQRMQESDYGEVHRREGIDTGAAQMLWKIFPWQSQGFGVYKLHMIQGGHDSVICEWKLRQQN